MNSEKLQSALEALLFIYGEPMDPKKIAAVLEVSVDEVKVAAKALSEHLDTENRGVALLTHKDQIQLVTRAEFSPLLEKVMKAELNESLTPAALETLSVIAYAGPISRAEIDYIRGVNSSFILRSLLLRGLIERELDPKRANAFLYTPSANFLQHLGLKSFAELPEFEKFKALAAEVKNPPAPASAEATQGKVELQSNESHT